MPRITRKQVNDALRAAGFVDVTIECCAAGGPYWYFAGPTAAGWYSSSVLVPRLSDLTVEQWVQEAISCADDR